MRVREQRKADHRSSEEWDGECRENKKTGGQGQGGLKKTSRGHPPRRRRRSEGQRRRRRSIIDYTGNYRSSTTATDGTTRRTYDKHQRTRHRRTPHGQARTQRPTGTNRCSKTGISACIIAINYSTRSTSLAAVGPTGLVLRRG